MQNISINHTDDSIRLLMLA